MAFQIGGLVGHIGIGRRMGLVKGIGGKGAHLIEYRVCGFLRNPIGDAAGAFHAAVLTAQAVDKMFPLLLHDLVLLFAHRPADKVGPAVGKTGKLAADLHHLLLIDDAAVGHIKNFGELRMLVGDEARIMPVADIERDGIHRTGAIERNDRDEILEMLRPELHQNLPDSGRFKLKNACRRSFGKSPVGFRIVNRNGVGAKVRLAPAHHLFAVRDDGEVAKPQKVHFEQAQFFEGGHRELGDDCAVPILQRNIMLHRFL